jgi:hypothetical protein
MFDQQFALASDIRSVYHIYQEDLLGEVESVSNVRRSAGASLSAPALRAAA